MLANGLTPSFSATSFDINTIAAAPSLSVLEFAAVTDPVVLNFAKNLYL